MVSSVKGKFACAPNATPDVPAVRNTSPIRPPYQDRRTREQRQQKADCQYGFGTKALQGPPLYEGFVREGVDKWPGERTRNRRRNEIREFDRRSANDDALARDFGRVEAALQHVDVGQPWDTAGINTIIDVEIPGGGESIAGEERGERRDEGIAPGLDDRHPPDQTVPFGADVDRGERRMFGELLERNREINGRTSIDRCRELLEDRQDHRWPRGREHLREGPVAVGIGRRTKIDIECDVPGAGFPQPLGELGVNRPGPGPGPQLLQALRVDLDDHELPLCLPLQQRETRVHQPKLEKLHVAEQIDRPNEGENGEMGEPPSGNPTGRPTEE